MKSLPVVARVYVVAVSMLGASALVILAPWGGFRDENLFFTLVVLSSLSAILKVRLALGRNLTTMSVSNAVDFASLFLLGPSDTMLVTAVGTWSQCTVRPRQRNPGYKTIFSIAALVLTVQVSGHCGEWVRAVVGESWTGVVAGVATTVTLYFLMNSVLVASAIALSSRQSIAAVWQENFLWSAPGYYLAGTIAAIAAQIAETSGGRYFAAIAAVPLYFIYRAYRVYFARLEDEQRQVGDLSKLHQATVEALALAIDAKDHYSHTHIRRVQGLAVAVGQSFGMNGPELEGLRTAALLHDIGKLAVPEHILSKPGGLTPEELKKVRIHPVVGAEIIAQVPFPYPVAPLILCHHERWDGRGYPSGLKGEEIPLGARILATMDFYDALVSDRPYHPAMSNEAAARFLEQEAGKAFDPAVVRRFLELLPDLPAEIEAGSPSLLNPRVIEGLSPQSSRPGRGDQPQALQDIALAHKEIHALYEIAQAMGTSLGVTDTMRLISSKLTTLVPFSCCALFLYDDANDLLQCRFATGTDAEAVRRITVKSGHGITGWVARNRQPLVNARPAADLEASHSDGGSMLLRTALVCPLVFNEEVIGTLAVYHTEDGFFTEDHCRLLERVSEQAAAVIANSIVFEKTQQDSLTDPLTSLPNTRFLLMHLTRELARAERLKSEVALLVLDLDEFKEINDHYGHHVGDRMLQEVAKVLRGAIRPYDICVRYAGDEFIVVLPGCCPEEAEHKRLHLQKAVDDIRLEARPGKVIAASVSAGAAIFPHDGDAYESLLAIADARMYREKSRREKTRERALPLGFEPRDKTDLNEIDLYRSAVGVL